MASVALGDSADGRWNDVALSLGVIGSTESAARAALQVLSHSGLVMEGRHLGSGLEAVERIPEGTEVIVITDDRPELAMVVQAAHRRAASAGLVVVVPTDASGEARGLLAAGADALVLDADVEEVLPAAVRSVALGQVSVPRLLKECVERPLLSHRDLRIVALAATGHTNGQIAAQLCLAESTIKAHLSSVFRRLGVKSRGQAAPVLLASGDDLERSLLASLLSGASQPLRR